MDYRFLRAKLVAEYQFSYEFLSRTTSAPRRGVNLSRVRQYMVILNGRHRSLFSQYDFPVIIRSYLDARHYLLLLDAIKLSLRTIIERMVEASAGVHVL